MRYLKAGAKHGSLSPASFCPPLFVSYMTGLLYLTLLEPIISDIYYFLFYHMPSGKGQHWFTFEYNLIPDFFYRFDGENIGNILMYLPFGFLHPSFRKDGPWKTILAGMSVSIGIELLQPVFGRRFDINDISKRNRRDCIHRYLLSF